MAKKLPRSEETQCTYLLTVIPSASAHLKTVSIDTSCHVHVLAVLRLQPDVRDCGELEDADVSRCLDMSDLVEVMLQDDFNGEYIEEN